MLIDTIRRELIERHDQQIAALIAAKPSIEAADRLETLLRDAGLGAHAVGHFNYDGCSVAVVSHADPERIEGALVLSGIEFSLVDAVRLERYTMRALQVSIDGQRVMLTIHHQPAVAVRIAA